MELSVCIVLMIVSLVMGGVITYFWLSRKYAQEISNLEVEILEVQRKGNHYRENIEDKLLHAQNAAEDRKKELLASVQAQKVLENKCQQFQAQAKEKTTLLNEANAELKKLRKEVEKNGRDKEGWKTEKATLLAEKTELLSERDRLLAENEFWLNEFDAKKHLLMGEESVDNESFVGEYEAFQEGLVAGEVEKGSEDKEEEIAETNNEINSEAILPANAPDLLMGQAKEVEETEIKSIYAVNERRDKEESQVVDNEVVEVTLINEKLDNGEATQVEDMPTEPQTENEEETIILNIPYLTEKIIEVE